MEKTMSIRRRSQRHMFWLIIAGIIIYWLYIPTTQSTQSTITNDLISDEDLTNPPENEGKIFPEPLMAETPSPYQPGTVKAPGEPYKKTLVTPRTSTEDVTWMHDAFDSFPDIELAIYTVDDVTAALHPPRNKGHEAMVYLSYIIDHYHDLSDVTLFMHNHQIAWHNNGLLGQNAHAMITRLSAERVVREGYMNMRCDWGPGCPDWMRPTNNIAADINKQEEFVFAQAWTEIFPDDPIPRVLAGPCCAQFAVSRERILALPREKYQGFRDWLLRTEYSDYISGRMWEYMWQWVFAGKAKLCPKEHVCYCDGFGVCFGSEERYSEFRRKEDRKRRKEDAMAGYWASMAEMKELEEMMGRSPLDPLNKERKVKMAVLKKQAVSLEPLMGELEEEVGVLREWCDRTLKEAMERGDVAIERAKEVGREWKEGDGF